MRKLILPALIILVFLSSACDQFAGELPDGFEHLGHDGIFHFVYINPKIINYKDKVLIRKGGSTVCKIYKQSDYCEVYLWDKKSLVTKALPIENRNDVVVIYSMNNGDITLKTLK